MAEIIVIGHKNPDTDSVCAAWCYARLKNIIDKENNYTAAVCGPIQAQAKFVFQTAGIDRPQHIKDVRARVIDITRQDGMVLDIDDPIMLAFEDLDAHTISIVPVFENVNEFRGIIGVHEMTRFFVSAAQRSRPVYTFLTDNIEKVVPGYFIQKGMFPEFSSPIMVGAMSYDDYVKRLKSLEPKKPVIVVGRRPDIIRHAVENRLPGIILIGLDPGEQIDFDFSGYNGFVFVSELDTSETVRLLCLSIPVKHIMDSTPPILDCNELFDNAKKILLASEYRGLPVIKDGHFSGVVTRRSFIEKSRKKLILVDHNELSHSILGAEDAEICEIIDHHRLGAEKTSTPIYVYSKPVGSTCTIVYSHYRMYNVPVDKPTALLLLSGLLSDTMLLRSPTTCPEDRNVALELSRLAEVDLNEYGNRMISRMAALKNSDPAQLIVADFKEYHEAGLSVGIGQVEVNTLADIEEARPSMLSTLNNVCKERNLDWGMLLVTDIVEEHSVLFTTAHPAAEELRYRKIGDNFYDLPDILSRKKQLLPEILRVMETIRKA